MTSAPTPSTQSLPDACPARLWILLCTATISFLQACALPTSDDDQVGMFRETWKVEAAGDHARFSVVVRAVVRGRPIRNPAWDPDQPAFPVRWTADATVRCGGVQGCGSGVLQDPSDPYSEGWVYLEGSPASVSGSDPPNSFTANSPPGRLPEDDATSCDLSADSRTRGVSGSIYYSCGSADPCEKTLELHFDGITADATSPRELSFSLYLESPSVDEPAPTLELEASEVIAVPPDEDNWTPAERCPPLPSQP